MKPFKFLKSPFIVTHDNGIINPGDIFYTLSKRERTVNHANGPKTYPKYLLSVEKVLRTDLWEPNYDLFYYFKFKQSAEFFKSRLIHWDEHVENR